jgi:sigma-B regulation protein RsbU (phosphoserine phosphatase)
MSGTSPRILIVDDIDDNRYTLRRRLKQQGYENITEAENGREALEKLGAERFDLVLLDIMMPEVDGYEVLESLEAAGRIGDPPVIMISAIDEIESVVRCIKLGAEDYLSKPFNATLLRARVGAVLQKKLLRDALKASHDRMQKELDAARRLQLGMVPSIFPEPTHERPVTISASMLPAREVGGDLYDFFFPTEGMCCFVIGDVSDKGTPAALFMARTRSLVRMSVTLLTQAHGIVPGPAAVLEAVNRELCQNNSERMFVTVFLGILNMADGTLCYANAGHPAPIRIAKAGGAGQDLAAPPRAPLGVSPRVRYTDTTARLERGDTVLTYTDGIPDANDPEGSFFGTDRLRAVLESVPSPEPNAVLRAVSEAVTAFANGAPAFDDLTMLAIRWEP